uniref:NADH-ubiquinone oxidoreductase chain 3 n=1 Tax=Strombidium cf. sulcatum TaxID=2793073 RepID=A0A7T0Q5D4_9SPIT|nr:NADH dehydrogenase subunit 3 [Strombidium cf. sulcatum]QPL15938.1 NADH dehydrogenase subunit 3 [Strombidium cf. sulcatum]
MGDFEVFLAFMSVLVLGIIVYNVVLIMTYKNNLKRFGFLKTNRRDYYECGFKPQQQKPIKISMQFLLICVFFLLYDIELIFLFPFVAGYTYSGLIDLLLIFFFVFVFFLSLLVDYERHALYWQE